MIHTHEPCRFCRGQAGAVFKPENGRGGGRVAVAMVCWHEGGAVWDWSQVGGVGGYVVVCGEAEFAVGFCTRSLTAFLGVS